MNTHALQYPITVNSPFKTRPNTAIVRADEVRPGDVICSDRPYLDMPVQTVTAALDGYIGFYAKDGGWRKYHKAGDMLMVRTPAPDWQVVDELEADAQRPMDWQDKLVTYGATAVAVFWLFMLVWVR